MNKINKLNKTILPLLAFVFFLSSCVKDTLNTTYNGPDLIEFASPSVIAPIVAPTTRTVSTTSATVANPRNDSMFVQLVGRQRSTDTKVTFAADPSSTAVVGTDYNIITPSPVTIPANSSSVKIRVAFINRVAAQRTLIFNLTGGDNVTPSENFKRFTFTLNP